MTRIYKIIIVLSLIFQHLHCAFAEKMKVEATELNKTSKECAEDSCARFELHFLRVIYPENLAVQDKINEQIVRRIIDVAQPLDAKTLEEKAEGFIKDYETLSSEAPSSEWYVKGEATKVYESEKVITIRYQEEGYTGGAHGYNKTIFMNFELQGGRELSLDDLFGDKKGDFAAVGEKKFRNVVEIPLNQSFADSGFFNPGGSFVFSEEWYLSEKGIGLFYNEYEAAGYAYGPIDVAIDAKEVLPYIKAEWQELLVLRDKHSNTMELQEFLVILDTKFNQVPI